MVKYTTIATDDDSYNISAIIINDKYEMPSLNFNIDGEISEIWDNEDYLINTLYLYLKNVIKDDELDYIFCNVKKDILEIFEEAIRMGFFHKFYIK